MGICSRREHLPRGPGQGADRDREAGVRVARGPDEPEARHRQHPQAHLRGAGEEKQAEFGLTLI